jgi:hypothetical protein
MARSRAQGTNGRQRLLVLRGHGWHAPFGASPPFSAHDLVRKPDTTFRDHAFAGGEPIFLRWRRGGHQSSDAWAPRERFATSSLMS